MMMAVLGGRHVQAVARSPGRRPARASHDSMTDVELVEWVISGRDGAAARLYDRFSGLINHVVLRVLGGDTEHDDLVHEAFLKVWAAVAAGRVQKPESLPSFVASVTTNVVYKELRKRYVRRRVFRREEPDPELCGHLPDMDAREGIKIVYAIAAELAPKDRLLFTLRHLGQYKLAQVAELSGCSLATVKRRLAKAEAFFVARARDYPEYPLLADLLTRGAVE